MNQHSTFFTSISLRRKPLRLSEATLCEPGIFEEAHIDFSKLVRAEQDEVNKIFMQLLKHHNREELLSSADSLDFALGDEGQLTLQTDSKQTLVFEGDDADSSALLNELLAWVYGIADVRR